MAEQEEEKIENIISEDASLDKKKGGLNSKIFIIGLPLFIVQLVAVYFITANLLMNQVKNNHPSTNSNSKVKAEQVKSKKIEYGKYLYSLNDIIANPANTDGKRLVLASVALDLNNENEEQKLKQREAVVRDIITTALSSKNLEQLSQNKYRDTLKITIAQNIQKMLPDIHLNNVYFSKFIIQ